jgi:hypothetical protein
VNTQLAPDWVILPVINDEVPVGTNCAVTGEVVRSHPVRLIAGKVLVPICPITGPVGVPRVLVPAGIDTVT